LINIRFAEIAQMSDAAAMETLLFLRSKRYTVTALVETTGLPQEEIERLLALGICQLALMGWSQQAITHEYRFSAVTINSVLRAAAKKARPLGTDALPHVSRVND